MRKPRSPLVVGVFTIKEGTGDMDKNKCRLLLLLLSAAALLVVMLGVPAAGRVIEERGKRTVSLSQDVMEKDIEDVHEELKAGEIWADGQQDAALMQTGDYDNIVLQIEMDTDTMLTRLWQSEDGTCYFFLPGYAVDATIRLIDAPNDQLVINGQVVRENDCIDDIAWEKAYTIEFSDEDEEDSLHKSTLIFKHSSKLPVLCLTTESGTMDKIHEDKEYAETGVFAYYDAQGTCSYQGEVEEIRGRGNSTWGLVKKPYQFKLYESVDLMGGGASKAYNLIANGYDETRLRNQIVAGLAEVLGMSYVPDEQMIDLYINDIYYGNYYLTEKVRVGNQGVDIRDMEEYAETDRYQEGLMPEIFENETGNRKWTAVQYLGGDISGGYLLERELEERYVGEISGFVTDQGDHYVLQSPRYATEEQVNYIADLFQAFQDAVEQPDGINPRTGKHYSDYIDMSSFIQKYLVEEVSKNYDGGVTSSFFYKPDDAVSQKIYAGPIWDYDVTFGNCNLDKIASNPLGITKLSNHVYGTDLFAALYEQPDFYEQMVRMYEEKALPYLDSLLDGGIDRMIEDSRLSAQMDSIRWENLENRYQYYENYDNDVRYLKYFIEKRRDFLNEVWLQNVQYHNVNFVVDGEKWQILCLKDGELPMQEPIPVKSSFQFVGWYTQGNVPFDIYKPVYEDITYYAIWQEFE